MSDSYNAWIGTRVDVSHKPMTREEFFEAMEHVRNSPGKDPGPRHFVPPERYFEAERAEREGGTREEIFMCLYGAKWSELKKKRTTEVLDE